jgi:integrase
VLYAACDVMKEPRKQPFSAGDWWRGLLMFAYMTGWRIGSILSLRWQDVDIEAGTAVSKAADNKGRRDQKIPLHPVILDHLGKLRSFDQHVFPWSKNRRKLFTYLHRLQDAAGVKPAGDKPYFGFHDLRRAFATMNAGRMTPDALQNLMQHKDYQTTQRYIAIARQLTPTVQDLYVPAVARKADIG